MSKTAGMDGEERRRHVEARKRHVEARQVEAQATLHSLQAECFVSVEAAAAFLGLKVSHVYELVRLNKMPSCKVGKFRRFRLSELEAWATSGGNGHPDPLCATQESAAKSA